MARGGRGIPFQRNFVFARQLLDAALEAPDAIREQGRKKAIDRRRIFEASQDIVLRRTMLGHFLRQLADAGALYSFKVMENAHKTF
jgi:hypothetical protein